MHEEPVLTKTRLKDYNLCGLIELMSIIANRECDGHYTIFKFTKGFKAFFGTPDLRLGGDDDKIYYSKIHPSLEEALTHALLNQIELG